MIKELYYLYQHVDPDSGEIVYIGMGTGSRAWATGTSSGSHRSPAHSMWISNLYEQGFTMGDIAKVTHTLLTKDHALDLELNLIKEVKPIYNRLGNPDKFYCKSFTPDQAILANELFEGGKRYYEIPDILNINSSNKSVTGKRMVTAGKQILQRTIKQ